MLIMNVNSAGFVLQNLCSNLKSFKDVFFCALKVVSEHEIHSEEVVIQHRFYL